MPWTLVNNGRFNWIYRNGDKGDGDLILKIAIENKSPLEATAIDVMDNYARSVRLWSEINPNLEPPPRIETVILNDIKMTGWVCPFIEGTKPSDSDIRDALIDIFNRTGRIIVDAAAKNNFIKTSEGKVVCIDIGMAVQLEEREEICIVGTRHRSSFSSLDTWRDMSHSYTNWFEDEPYHQHIPETIQTVKALLFIKDHRPDITNVDFLTRNPQALGTLAHAYDMEHIPDSRLIPAIQDSENAVVAAENIIASEQNLSLESIKQYCRDKLIKVITPPSSPRQSPDFTDFNTQYAMDLLRKVNQCQNIVDMHPIFNTIHDIEQIIETENTAAVPIAMQQIPIREVHRNLLTELDAIDNLHVSKHNCLQILTQFLAQHGKMKAHELETLKMQFSSSPKEKVQYYKTQMNNEKLSAREKEVIQLIKWIDNATTFEEIDEFILKFEASKPEPRDPSTLNFLEKMYTTVRGPTLEERLSQSLAQCKLAIATAKSALDSKLVRMPGVDKM